MAFRTNFILAEQPQPNWWREYACITLQRMLYYGVHNQFERFASWLGADGYSLQTPTNDDESPWCVFWDRSNAFAAFDGTRGFTQWRHNIIYGTGRFDPITVTLYHSYFLWRAQQVTPRLNLLLAQLPISCPLMTCGHSLGGAIAYILQHRARFNSHYRPGGVLTFGQPRVRIFSPNYVEPVPYVRIARDDDIVPAIPAPVSLGYNENLSPLSLVQGAVYHHTVDGLELDRHGGLRVGSDPLDSVWVDVIPRVFAAPDTLRTYFARTHWTNAYREALSRTGQVAAHSMTLAGLASINEEIDAFDRGDETITNSSIGSFGGGEFDDPDATYPSDSGRPTAPPNHRGVLIERRSLSHSLYFFGGIDLMAKTFQAHDRRLLTHLEKLCSAAIARDARVANPKKTRRLSNRILMFPPGGNPSLSNALANVRAQCLALLALGS